MDLASVHKDPTGAAFLYYKNILLPTEIHCIFFLIFLFVNIFSLGEAEIGTNQDTPEEKPTEPGPEGESDEQPAPAPEQQAE